MAANEYVWFLPDWMAKSNSLRHNNASNCKTHEIEAVLEGHFTISNSNDDDQLQNNNSTLQQIKDNLLNQGLSRIVFNDLSKFVEGSIWLYAIALSKCLKIKPEFPFGLTNATSKQNIMACLIVEMHNTNFQGLSGHVRFASHLNPVLTNKDVRQWSNGSWIEVFSFREDSGKRFALRKAKPVIWLSNTIPWDGTVTTTFGWKILSIGLGCLLMLAVVARFVWINYSRDDTKLVRLLFFYSVLVKHRSNFR